jgi:hypothetical protein
MAFGRAKRSKVLFSSISNSCSGTSPSGSATATQFFFIRKDYTSARAELTHLYNSTWVGIVAFSPHGGREADRSTHILEREDFCSGYSVSTLLCIPQGTLIHLLFVWTVVGHCFLCLTIVSDRMKDGRGGVAIFSRLQNGDVSLMFERA